MVETKPTFQQVSLALELRPIRRTFMNIRLKRTSDNAAVVWNQRFIDVGGEHSALPFSVLRFEAVTLGRIASVG